MGLLKKIIQIGFVFCPFFLHAAYGNSDCFKFFLEDNYNEESIYDHVQSSNNRAYLKELSGAFTKLLVESEDSALKGMIGKILGADGIAQGNKRAISLMIQVYKDRNSRYLERKGMVQGLGYLLGSNDEAGLKILYQALKDRSSIVRKEAAISIGKIKPRNYRHVKKILLDLAENHKENKFVRAEAIKALVEILPLSDQSSIIPNMRDLLKDRKREVRQSALSALLKINESKYEVIESLNIQQLYREHSIYMEQNLENRKRYEPPAPFKSWFEVRIFLAIHKKGYFVIPQFEIEAGKTVSRASGQAPYVVDFVVVGPGGKKVAIECDGGCHNLERVQKKDMQRQKAIERFGWDVYRISHRDFYYYPEETLEELWAKLSELGIQPFSKQSKSSRVKRRQNGSYKRGQRQNGPHNGSKQNGPYGSNQKKNGHSAKPKQNESLRGQEHRFSHIKEPEIMEVLY